MMCVCTYDVASVSRSRIWRRVFRESNGKLSNRMAFLTGLAFFIFRDVDLRFVTTETAIFQNFHLRIAFLRFVSSPLSRKSGSLVKKRKTPARNPNLNSFSNLYRKWNNSLDISLGVSPFLISTVGSNSPITSTVRSTTLRGTLLEQS